MRRKSERKKKKAALPQWIEKDITQSKVTGHWGCFSKNIFSCGFVNHLQQHSLNRFSMLHDAIQ